MYGELVKKFHGCTNGQIADFKQTGYSLT